MNHPTLLFLIGALIIYLVSLQFIEQKMSWRSLLILPILSAYLCYIDLLATSAYLSLPLLFACFALGVLPGLITGIYRGQHTLLRIDRLNQQIFFKPEPVSSLVWLGIMLVRTAALILHYGPLSHSLFVTMFLTFTGSLFVVSIITQRLIICLRINQVHPGIHYPLYE